MMFHERLPEKILSLIGEGRIGLEHVLEAPTRRASQPQSAERGGLTDNLAGAAEHENQVRDPAEAIHDLRVALRTLRSVLRPIQIVYGKRGLEALEERLADILDLTSELRDEEVLRETLTHLKVSERTQVALGHWMIGRARRERGLRARATRALSEPTRATGEERDADLLASKVAICLGDIQRAIARGPKRAIDHGAFQRDALERASRTLDKRARASRVEDAESMHRVRIGAKRLRYVAELLGDLLEEPDDARAADLMRIGKSSARIQKRLGQLHDFDEALSRMGRAWGLDKGPRNEVLQALRAARRSAADRSWTELLEERGRIDAALARIYSDPEPKGAQVAFARPRDVDEDATG